jgi:hypothetical protein
MDMVRTYNLIYVGKTFPPCLKSKINTKERVYKHTQDTGAGLSGHSNLNYTKYTTQQQGEEEKKINV